MSTVGMGSSNDAGKIFNTPAKNLGTAPTEAEKKIANEAVEAVKEAAGSIKDSASAFIKTPEGKAITTGVMLKTVMPFNLIGDVFILGGIAGCAKNYLDSQQAEPAAQQAGKALGKGAAQAARAAATVALAPVLGPAAIAIQAAKAISNAAAQSPVSGSEPPSAGTASSAAAQAAIAGARAASDTVKENK